MTNKMPFERTIVITLRAASDLEFDKPLDEAVKRIKAGNIEGHDMNENTSFNFSVDTFFHEDEDDEEGSPA